MTSSRREGSKIAPDEVRRSGRNPGKELKRSSPPRRGGANPIPDLKAVHAIALESTGVPRMVQEVSAMAFYLCSKLASTMNGARVRPDGRVVKSAY